MSMQKLDADLELPPDYLARIMATLESEPQVGIAGSQLSMPSGTGGKANVEPSQSWHVRGATKFYRRRCWAAIDPLPQILGWDTIDEIGARMHGWETASFPTAGGDSLHLRPTSSRDGILRGHRRRGACAWGYGAHPLHVAASVALRVRDRPRVLASLAYLGGYFDAGLRRAARVEAGDAPLPATRAARPTPHRPTAAGRAQGRKPTEMKPVAENGAVPRGRSSRARRPDRPCRSPGRSYSSSKRDVTHTTGACARRR